MSWTLSTKRSRQCERSVKRHVAEAHGGLEDLWGISLSDMIQPRGYGSTVPLPGFDDGGNYVENRRVEMRLLEPGQEGYLSPFSIVEEKASLRTGKTTPKKGSKGKKAAVGQTGTKPSPAKPPSRLPPGRPPPGRAPPNRPKSAPLATTEARPGASMDGRKRATTLGASYSSTRDRPNPFDTAPPDRAPPSRPAPLQPTAARPGASLFPTGGDLSKRNPSPCGKLSSARDRPNPFDSISTDSSGKSRCNPFEKHSMPQPTMAKPAAANPMRKPTHAPPAPPNLSTGIRARVDKVEPALIHEEKKRVAPRVPKHVGFGGGAVARPVSAPPVNTTHAFQGQDTWSIAACGHQPKLLPPTEGTTSVQIPSVNAPKCHPPLPKSKPPPVPKGGKSPPVVPSKPPPPPPAQRPPSLPSKGPSPPPNARASPRMPEATAKDLDCILTRTEIQAGDGGGGGLRVRPFQRLPSQAPPPEAPALDPPPRRMDVGKQAWGDANYDNPAPKVARLAPVFSSALRSAQLVAEHSHSVRASASTSELPTTAIPIERTPVRSASSENLARGLRRPSTAGDSAPPRPTLSKTKGWTSSKQCVDSSKSFKTVVDCILTRSEIRAGNGGGGLRVRPFQLTEIDDLAETSTLGLAENSWF